MRETWVEADREEYLLDGPGTMGRGRMRLRTKTIRSGDYLECEIYPMVPLDTGTRAKRRERSPESIQRANERAAVKNLERLLNCNFGPGDLLVHLTCADNCTFEEMRRRTRNWIRRVKTRYERTGIQCDYVYVIETTGTEDRERHHLHAVLRRGPLTRDELEALWGHGLARIDRCQRQEKGLAGFANYITQKKATQVRMMKRRWGCSKGLKRPKVTVSDTKFSRAAAQRVAEAAEMDARAEFERRYPGYRLIEQPTVRRSEWMPGAYIYAYMERKR